VDWHCGIMKNIAIRQKEFKKGIRDEARSACKDKSHYQSA
jgi:hypothetical protein